MPFAPPRSMSKQNNVNPSQYQDGDRNHQGEGIVHQDEKHKHEQQEGKPGKEGTPNFIPGAAPVGEKKKK